MVCIDASLCSRKDGEREREIEERETERLTSKTPAALHLLVKKKRHRDREREHERIFQQDKNLTYLCPFLFSQVGSPSLTGDGKSWEGEKKGEIQQEGVKKGVG